MSRHVVIGSYMVTEQADGHACITENLDGVEVVVLLCRTYDKALAEADALARGEACAS